MKLTAMEEPPPPPPSKRYRKMPRLVAWPVRIRTRLRICMEWSEHARTPEGRLALVEHLVVTRTVWLKDKRSRDVRWRSKSNGFLVIAYRIVW